MPHVAGEHVAVLEPLWHVRVAAAVVKDEAADELENKIK